MPPDHQGPRMAMFLNFAEWLRYMKSNPLARSVAPHTLPPASGSTSSAMRPFESPTAFHGRETEAREEPSKRK